MTVFFYLQNLQTLKIDKAQQINLDQQIQVDKQLRVDRQLRLDLRSGQLHQQRQEAR